MAKFAFFLAIVIAFVAVTSATWIMTGPVTNSNITPGSLISFTFKNTENFYPFGYESTYIKIETDYPLVSTFFIAGEGLENHLCTISNGDVVAKTRIEYSRRFRVEFINPVKKADVVTCKFRVVTDPSIETTITSSSAADEVVLTVLNNAPPAIKITSVKANDDKTVDVSIEFNALAASTLYGPLTFGYEFNKNDAQSETQTINILDTMGSSDFNAVFAPNVRLVVADNQFWLLTNAALMTSTSVTLQYPAYDLRSVDSYYDGTNYFAWAKLLNNIDLKVVARIPVRKESAQAQIRYSGTEVTYSMKIFSNTVTNPTFKFSIDKYGPDVIFGPQATLRYYVKDGSDGYQMLDFTNKSLEYSLIAPIGSTITVYGTFDAPTYELATINASIELQSASDKIKVSTRLGEITIGSVSAGRVLTYTFTIVSEDTDYTDPIDYGFQSFISYDNEGGDIRALNAYSPNCKSDMGLVFVGGQVTKDNLDANRIPVFTSGTLAKGSATHTITCTQQRHAGAKSSRLSITVNSGKSKNNISRSKDLTWVKPDFSPFTRRITIYGPAIADDASFKAVTNQATSILIANPSTSQADYIYHYSKGGVQHYAAHFAGLVFDFNNPLIAHSSKAGSILVLTFHAKTDADLSETIVLYGSNMVIKVDPAYYVDNPFMGLTAVAAFIDGSVSTGYELSNSILHGLGFKCVTSAQCNSGYCLDKICSGLDQLSRAQQEVVRSQPEAATSAASAVVTTLALIILVCVTLLL